MSEKSISIEIRVTNRKDIVKIQDALNTWINDQDKTSWISHGFICYPPKMTFFIKTSTELSSTQIDEIYAILDSFKLKSRH